MAEEPWAHTWLAQIEEAGTEIKYAGLLIAQELLAIVFRFCRR